jgi:hypothetical protein
MKWTEVQANIVWREIQAKVTQALIFSRESYALFLFLQIFPASLSNQITWIFLKIGSTNNFIFD